MKWEVGRMSVPDRRCTNHGSSNRRRVTRDPHLRLGKVLVLLLLLLTCIVLLHKIWCISQFDHIELYVVFHILLVFIK